MQGRSKSVSTVAPGSSTAFVTIGALTPSNVCSSCRQDKLSDEALFVFLQQREAELVWGRVRDFSGVLCLAGWIDVFPFFLRRSECSCHLPQSTKSDFWICSVSGQCLCPEFRSVLVFSLLRVFIDPLLVSLC